MLKLIFGTVIFLVVVVGFYATLKTLPEGVAIHGQETPIPSTSVRFLADRTFVDGEGVRQTDHEIFSEILALIGGAEEYILIDMFLFNDFLGAATSAPRSLSKELTDALIAKKTTKPSISITFITDPINEVYGGATSSHLTALREAGVTVVTTNLSVLRDSNPLYSSLWRIGLQFIPPLGVLVPNVFSSSAPKVPLSSYLTLLNFKANHRKLLVADAPAEDGGRLLVTLVTSFNPHDGSAAHSNVALRIEHELWREVVKGETAIAAFSGVTLPAPEVVPSPLPVETETVIVQLLTEKPIKSVVISEIGRLGQGDELALAMFYLSDRALVGALKEAAARGATVRLLLDPNKDAFGRTKNGIPNRQVAHELASAGSSNMEIRWCNTSGEQCHSKLMLLRRGDEHQLVLGSANFTRRNLDNLNLEANVRVIGKWDSQAIADAWRFFEEQWHNENNRIYSVPYSVYAEQSFLKKTWYRIGEFTGLSTY